MAKINLYITSHGKITRKANTIYFIKAVENGIEKHIIPIKKLRGIHCMARVSVSSGAIHYLSRHNVPIHFYNKYGYYLGSLMPRKYLLSGYLLVNQVKHYLNREARLYIAKQFIYGALSNMARALDKHRRLEKVAEEIRRYRDDIERASDIETLMSIEGNSRSIYYQSFNKILPREYHFSIRTRRPPKTRIDALISFGNSLLYGTVLTEIYHTQLDPTISYLHQPSERRYSLSLDISEVFKPIIVDRTIFTLVNRYGLDPETDFHREMAYTLLSREGREKFLKVYEEVLRSTVRHRSLKRKVTIQNLIRLECYKLIKHILGLEKYRALVAWW